VCRTYASDPIASKAILTQHLAADNLRDHGFEEIPILAREANRLLKIAPDFVRDLYQAAFGFSEGRTDEVSMGPGRILSLKSTRRQDYQLSHSQLAEIFPTFLRTAVEMAVQSLATVIQSKRIDRSSIEDLESSGEPFVFNGVNSEIKTDISHIWDSSTQYRHEAVERMLDALEDEMLGSAANTVVIKQIITAIARHNKWAAAWRRVIVCGTRHPTTIGLEIVGLASSLPPANTPPGIISGWCKEYNEAEFLAEQGVPVNEEPNRRIINLTNQLNEFVSSHNQHAPTFAEVQTLFPTVRALHEALQTNDSGLHERQKLSGWTYLMAACSCLALCSEWKCDSEIGANIKSILLTGADHENPTASAEQEARFDEHTTWSPAPRIDAAEGLLLLSNKPSCVDANLIQKITKLSADPVGAVRLRIADRLNCLKNTFPEKMLDIMTRMAEMEKSSSVLSSLLYRQVHPLIWTDHLKAGELATIADQRTDFAGDSRRKVRAACVTIFLDLWLLKGHAASQAEICKISANVMLFSKDATTIISRIRDILVAGPVSPEDPQAQVPRMRSFTIFEGIAKSVHAAYPALQKRNNDKPFQEWPTEDQELAREVLGLADSIATQLYFASGAYDKRQTGTRDIESARPLDVKRRFLNESTRLFDFLAGTPHPSIIHHLVGTLEFFMDVDPRNVLIRIVTIVKAGKSGGYQYESLAADLIVRFANRVFADFRSMFQDHQDVRKAMVELLDIFVEAGWPQAIQLTYRLDEIFR
jgi:hypothetical protein